MRTEGVGALGRRRHLARNDGRAVWFVVAPDAASKLTGQCHRKPGIHRIEHDLTFGAADNLIDAPVEREGLPVPDEGSVTVRNANCLARVDNVMGRPQLMPPIGVIPGMLRSLAATEQGTPRDLHDVR